MASNTDIYTYLDNLRTSGVTNMFGAGRFLMDKFQMDKETANRWLNRWMRDFIK